MGFELRHGMYYTTIVTFWKSTLENTSEYKLYGKTYYKIWVNALFSLKFTIIMQLLNYYVLPLRCMSVAKVKKKLSSQRALLREFMKKYFMG